MFFLNHNSKKKTVDLNYTEFSTIRFILFLPPILAPQEFCQALQQPDAKVFKNYLKVGIWNTYTSSYN